MASFHAPRSCDPKTVLGSLAEAIYRTLALFLRFRASLGAIQLNMLVKYRVSKFAVVYFDAPHPRDPKTLLGSLVEAIYCTLALFLRFRAPLGMI